MAWVKFFSSEEGCHKTGLMKVHFLGHGTLSRDST
jgi:hypothetical protein